MEPRTTCRKCGAGILMVTARYHHGHCAPCWDRRPSKRVPLAMANTIFGILFALAFPLIVAWECLVIFWKRWRFPYRIAPIRRQVESVFRDRRDTRLYLRGLIRGYLDPGPYFMFCRPRDLANQAGLNDGTALRDGRVEVSELPTRRIPFDHGMISPHSVRKIR